MIRHFLGGTLTMEDLGSFQAKEADAWTVPIGEFIMYIPPPPAGGGILSLILNIMKGELFNQVKFCTTCHQ